jgi:hypothetical protein
VIHLYGVVQELEELPPVAGLDGAPLESRQIDGLEVVVSHVESERPSVSEEAVLRHAEVVEELLARSGAVLPAQLGRPFADEADLEAAVRTKAAELERGLTRVRGCVEFGLRVVSAEASDSGERPESGRDYMRVRLAETVQRDRVADEFHRPLSRLSRANARFGGAGADLLAAAYLVPDENLGAFRDQVDRLELAHPELGVVCTGPWPPYTFAGEGEENE